MAANTLKIFLKLDTIEGEVTSKDHAKEIEVLSYEQGLETPVPTGGGRGSRVRFSEVRIRKYVDKASIPMMLASAKGQRLRSALFTFRRGFDFYKVTLEDVLITKFVQRAGTETHYPLSFDTLNAGADASDFLDEVSLNFTRIRWEHRAQRANGSVVTTSTGGWDLRNNRPL